MSERVAIYELQMRAEREDGDNDLNLKSPGQLSAGPSLQHPSKQNAAIRKSKGHYSSQGVGSDDEFNINEMMKNQNDPYINAEINKLLKNEIDYQR